MITATYEFEVFEGEEGLLLAYPYDMDGGTQGEGFDDLCEMVSDWLRCEVEYREVHDIPMPRATFGNSPRHGGSNMVVSVTAGRETVEKVSASHAAQMLGISRGRVTQMVASGLLEGWREGRNAYVTLDSVQARIKSAPQTGRPRKATAMA